LISKFLDEVAQDSGKYCFGIKETMQGLDAGAVETLILWEGFDMSRIVIRNPHTGTSETKFLTKEELKSPTLYKDPETNVDLVIDEEEPYLDWIVENYKNFGAAKLEFVTDRSQEGNQFVKGFGGIGGLMRYRIEFELLEEPDFGAEDSDDDFM